MPGIDIRTWSLLTHQFLHKYMSYWPFNRGGWSTKKLTNLLVNYRVGINTQTEPSLNHILTHIKMMLKLHKLFKYTYVSLKNGHSVYSHMLIDRII